jgi:hypothetical protein
VFGSSVDAPRCPIETTIALSHLIFEGTLDAFPGLKICGAHAGGYLPSYAARSDKGCETFPQRGMARQFLLSVTVQRRSGICADAEPARPHPSSASPESAAARPSISLRVVMICVSP